MELLLLTLHNVLRWLVLAALVWALFRAYQGWLAKKPWTAADNTAGAILAGSMDVQVLLGIILYIFPGTFTRVMLGNMGAAMSTPEVRFFAVEHILVMLVALVVIHIGRSRAKKAASDQQKHTRSAIFYTVAGLMALFSIPWWRPLLRLFGFEL